ncbi:MAG: alpha/beta fold hydrolase [Pseudomonadota bacterium]
MDQKQAEGQTPDPRAEAAYELLRSLARAGDDPDQFAQACLDWSRLSDDAMSMPDFMAVLAVLSDRPAKDEGGVARDIGEDIDPSDMFSIDQTGVVVRLLPALSTRLGLLEGDVVDESLNTLIPANRPARARIIELPDRFGIKRQIKVSPVVQGDEVSGYLAFLVLTRLSARVRQHLQHQYGLTKSEIEILELVLQRHSLEQIADIRDGKLNTVRTHVSRLNGKLECHSLVETVSKTIEISNAIALRSPQHVPANSTDENGARRIKLETPGAMVEYRRYGSSSGHPVIVLHSLEYGYMPSQRMIEAARARHLNLIFPIRPGFGDTSSAPSLQKAADMMSEFIRVLKLEDVTLVGLSMAAPMALLVQDRNARIGRTLLVNYGLNVSDKVKGIQPSWIRGLLRMGLTSPTSFAFGARTINSMIRTFGGKRFYRMLYRSQASDLAFVEGHLEQFSLMADYIAGSDRTHSRLDIQSAFLPNPDLEALLGRAGSVRVLNGAEQHGVGVEDSEADAKRLGVAFKRVQHPGRNWMFQHPEALFAEMLS